MKDNSKQFFDTLNLVAGMGANGQDYNPLIVPDKVLSLVPNMVKLFESYGVDPVTCFTGYKAESGNYKLSLPGVWYKKDLGPIILFNFKTRDRGENILVLNELKNFLLTPTEKAGIYNFSIGKGDVAVRFPCRVHLLTDSFESMSIDASELDSTTLKTLGGGTSEGKEFLPISDLVTGDSWTGPLELFNSMHCKTRDGKPFISYSLSVMGQPYKIPKGLGESITAQLTWLDVDPCTLKLTIIKTNFTYKNHVGVDTPTYIAAVTVSQNDEADDGSDDW